MATAFRISTFSLKELAVAVAPAMTEGGSILTLDFDNRIAWPIYDWMGVCKAGLEATVRYLARDLGAKKIRVNALAAGPLITLAAKSIPGFRQLADTWSLSAPLGWNARTHHSYVARDGGGPALGLVRVDHRRDGPRRRRVPRHRLGAGGHARRSRRAAPQGDRR